MPIDVRCSIVGNRDKSGKQPKCSPTGKYLSKMEQEIRIYNILFQDVVFFKIKNTRFIDKWKNTIRKKIEKNQVVDQYFP